MIASIVYYVILLICTMFVMAGWGMATVFFSFGLFMKVMDFV